MDTIEMSGKELTRLEVMQRLKGKRMTQAQAGSLQKAQPSPDIGDISTLPTRDHFYLGLI